MRPLWSTCLRRGPFNTNAQGETSGLEPVRGRGTCGTAQRGAAVKSCQRVPANTLAVAWRSTAAAQLSLMHLTKPAFITDPIQNLFGCVPPTHERTCWTMRVGEGAARPGALEAKREEE